MEELGPEELEELVQELEEESEKEEALSPEVEKLLRDLQPLRGFMPRLSAARQLGGISTSSHQVVQALLAAAETDDTAEVRAAASESLRAPVHQAILQEDADLMMRAQQEAAPKDWRAEMLASPVKPERFRVEPEGDTLSLSWRDGALHKVLSAGVMLLLLLVLGYALFAGTYSGEDVCVVALAPLLPGYWVLVAFVNSTQITLGREEWIFQRGPFPFPNRRFYSGRIRIDPAAYREIRAVAVEEKRRGGGSTDIAQGIAELLLEQFMEPRIIYSLYARAEDGSDKLLLAQLEQHEAAYLRSTLQDRLDARGGPSVRE